MKGKWMLEAYKDIVDVKDLIEILPIGRSKIYELLRTGQIYNKKIGSKFIIPKQSVIDFLLN